MILCNPHNPTGRCWSANELEQLLLLCEAYDVTLISDEIWADLLLPGETFTSVLHLGSAGINGSSPPLRPAKRLAYRRCEFLIFSFPILRFASVSCLVWTLMGWTSLTLSPFRRRLPHGMKADSGWIRYWITAENRRWFVEQATEHLPGQELSRRREPIYYGWIVKTGTG